MVSNKNGRPVSALKKWALTVSCLIIGLLLGLFISDSARNDLDMAREWPVDGKVSPAIGRQPVQITPPPDSNCTGLKEGR